MAFDPDQPASGEGIFGLPVDSDARVHLVPVPFEATVSRRRGTAEGPSLILRESAQVDLFDLETGHPYRAGIIMHPPRPEIGELDRTARGDADLVIAAGGPVDPPTRAATDRVNAVSKTLNTLVYEEVRQHIDAGRIVGTIGGDHSIAFGAIQAHVGTYGPLGVLQFDAHADLREAYEGFEYSHASVMERVIAELPKVSLVQVGVRDLGVQEHAAIQQHPRIRTWFGPTLAQARLEGRLLEAFDAIVSALPERVYVSFDVDGLDPRYCPGTGTPVPGGFSFEEASILLGRVAAAKRIVGFDLVEVAGDTIDGDVGARLLYKLIGWTLRSQSS